MPEPKFMLPTRPGRGFACRLRLHRLCSRRWIDPSMDGTPSPVYEVVCDCPCHGGSDA